MVIAVAGIVFLLFLFVLAGLLLASIVVEDWNTRLISFKTLIELVVVRVSLAGLIILVDSSAVDIGGEFSSSLALFCEQLSFLSLGLSCAMAVVVVALIKGLSMVTKKARVDTKRKQWFQRWGENCINRTTGGGRYKACRSVLLVFVSLAVASICSAYDGGSSCFGWILFYPP